MAEQEERNVDQSVVENTIEQVHGDSSSNDRHKNSTSSFKSKLCQIFSREEQSVHKVLGGGKIANVFLWRDKKLSAGVLGGTTAIWLLLEVIGCHLLTLLSHVLILALVILFLWSFASTFINKSTPRIPEVCIPEETVLPFASAVNIGLNHALADLRDIVLERNFKKFFCVVSGLWFLSIVSSCFNFLTLFYLCFVLLFTVPVLYEKYEDKVDSFAEKAIVEIKKLYELFDARVFSKIPRGPVKDKKA